MAQVRTLWASISFAHADVTVVHQGALRTRRREYTLSEQRHQPAHLREMGAALQTGLSSRDMPYSNVQIRLIFHRLAEFDAR